MKKKLFLLGCLGGMFLLMGSDKPKINSSSNQESYYDNQTTNTAPEIAFCLLNLLPSSGEKVYGKSCNCDQRGKDPFHGWISTCSNNGIGFCQAEACAISGCCYIGKNSFSDSN